MWLQDLDCCNNKLTSFPLLPQYIDRVCFDNNCIPDVPLGKILLQQHNQRRTDLGLKTVKKIENNDEIWHRWTLLQYQLDSEEYQKAAKEIN